MRAILEAYSASGTWRRLAVDIGMNENDAAILCYIARTNHNVSGRAENTVRQALGLGPARRRNPRIDIACTAKELEHVMAMTPRQRAEAMLEHTNEEMK